jgi:hypothetical protein
MPFLNVVDTLDRKLYCSPLKSPALSNEVNKPNLEVHYSNTTLPCN